MPGYVPMYRRRRSGATDYKARRGAIVSRSTLLAVRVSGKNVTAQFLRPTVHGDEVLSSVHSHSLRKLGWKGPLKSLPACYLLGLWAGKQAKKDGIESANLYNGLTPFVKGSRISAFLKGVVDAGVDVPHSKEVLPSEDRIKGENIASYAAALASQDKEAYEKRFSGVLKQGFKPEEYAQNYARTKDAIMTTEVKQ
jgi:large subunit ribosomal protein L18